jgi:MoxR-like ATPase
MNERQMRDWMKENLGRLKTLRDEIRVDLHLAGMDAREKWKELEPVVRDAEKLAEDVSDVSRRAMEEMVEKFRRFRESVRQHQQPGGQA